MPKQVFITGGTGYLRRRLIPMLLQKGYTVKALTRKGSEQKLPSGCISVVSDPFDANAFAGQVERGSTFIQLLGVSHPGPSKKALFYKIDFASVSASVAAATQAGVNISCTSASLRRQLLSWMTTRYVAPSVKRLSSRPR